MPFVLFISAIILMSLMGATGLTVGRVLVSQNTILVESFNRRLASSFIYCWLGGAVAADSILTTVTILNIIRLKRETAIEEANGVFHDIVVTTVRAALPATTWTILDFILFKALPLGDRSVSEV